MQKIKQIIYGADLFAISEFLRYKGQSNSRTLTGGFISIAALSLIISLFISKLIVVFQKTQITITQTTIQNVVKSPLYIETPSFMIGISSSNLNLSDPHRHLFDMYIQDNQQYYPLETCTKSHWAGSTKVQNNFNSLGMSGWLCLPLNIKFVPLSLSYSYRLVILRCNPNTDRCVSEQEFASWGTDNTVLTINVLNTVVNPSGQQYILNYLESGNQITLIYNHTIVGRMQFSDYTVITDQSIFLFEEKIYDKGFSQHSSLQTISDTGFTTLYLLGVIQINHSLQQNTYTRKFYKIDDVLSYVGGLFNTLMAICALTKFYSEDTFEFIVGSRLFFSKPQLKTVSENLKKYNLFSFAKQKLQQSFGCLATDNLLKYRKEIKQQLDVVYLFERIYFLQKILFTLFDEHEITGLMIFSYVTIEEVEKKRKKLQIALNFQQDIESKAKQNEKQINQFIIESTSRIKKQKKKQSDNNEQQNQYSRRQKQKENQAIVSDLRKIKQEADRGNKTSKKIWKRLLAETLKLMKLHRFHQNPLDSLYNDVYEKDVEQATALLLDLQNIQAMSSTHQIKKYSYS